MKTNIHILTHLAHFFLKRKMFRTKLRRKSKYSFVISNFFCFENRAVCEKMRKNFCRAGQATDINLAHAHCTLDT